MVPSRMMRTFLFCFAVACVVPSLSAEIIETRKYHGKKVDCVFSGLWSTGGYLCGIRGYARVFTGTVKSVTAISDTDRRLELIPDEIFLGSATEVTATVNQACMPLDQPEIQAGDRWLFFLAGPWSSGKEGQQEEGLVLPYGSRSGPLTSERAQEEVSTLRHLERLTDSGVVVGRVTRTEMKDQKLETLESVPVPDWALTAKGVASGIEYTTLTDSNGHFEFELPPDSYSVTANTQRGSWALDRDPPVRTGDCVDVDFPIHPDGELSGTVTTADGMPASNVHVEILRVSPWHETSSVETDAQGHFEARGLEPGRYFIGAWQPDTIYSCKNGHCVFQGSIRLRGYYQGVPNREQAIPIDLDKSEWRSNIDFKLPASK